MTMKHPIEHHLRLRTARSFSTRLLGLMFRRGLPPGEALLLTQCAGVHTAFMRFVIDVVYLDRHGCAVKLVPALRPWRASWGGPQARHTLELASGDIARLGLRCGDTLIQPVSQPAARPAR